MKLAQDTLYIFTDGSCWPNPGPGGWGAVLIWNDQFKLINGGSEGETNNTMELKAILKGLEARKDHAVPALVYSDSRYCIDALTKWWKGWERKGWVTAKGDPVKNQEYIREILHIADNVSFKWIKGHSGNPLNDAADLLATHGRTSLEAPCGLSGGASTLTEVQEMIRPYLPGPSESPVLPFFPSPLTAPEREEIRKPARYAVSRELRTTIAGMVYATERAKTWSLLESKEQVARSYEAADLFIQLSGELGEL